MLRLSQIASIGGALVVAFLSLSMANAESMTDSMPLSHWAADIFADAVRDNIALLDEAKWPDVSALSYARSRRPGTPGVRWLTQPMPAVDGINGKIAGFGGGANHTSGLYGANGSLAFPLAQQWGAQIDGAIGSFANSGFSRGAGHLFWRDPSIGLVGAYGSYSHWNGIGALNIPRIGVNIGRYAAEGEYYSSRWTLRGLAGYETVHLDVPNVAGLAGSLSIPNRFFDWVSASYYVTDNVELSIGHLYTIGRHGLTLSSEYGFALGGGRMASLFAAALLAEGGHNAVLGGLRLYFGQRDKTLIDRHRQDDPISDSVSNVIATIPVGSGPVGGLLVVPSDMRLKCDIVALGRLDNGLGLYRYRYFWSDQIFVGVMAQEVAEILPEAVAVDPQGYMKVDYGRLGLRMQTWEEWASSP